MSGWSWLAVAIGAAVGAPARYWVDRRCLVRWGTRWPVGTLIVNLVGCLVLGLVTGFLAAAGTSPVSAGSVVLSAGVGTGFCGALTTFGGFGAQILDLERRSTRPKGSRRAGVAYAAVSVTIGVGLAVVGYAAGSGLG